MALCVWAAHPGAFTQSRVENRQHHLMFWQVGVRAIVCACAGSSPSYYSTGSSLFSSTLLYSPEERESERGPFKQRCVRKSLNLIFIFCLLWNGWSRIDTGPGERQGKMAACSNSSQAPGQPEAWPSNPTSLRLESFIVLEALNGALAIALKSHSTRRKQQKNNGTAG